MQRDGFSTFTGRQKWRCPVQNNERMQDWYDGLTGLEFNALLLKRRRTKALHRRRERSGQVSPEG